MSFALLVSPNSHASQNELKLDGAWKQPCAQQATWEERFSGSTCSLVESNYVDADCATPGLEIEDAGECAFDTDSVPAGQRSIDFTFEVVRVTIRSQTYLDYFEARSMCGITAWKIGEPRDITGKSCEFYGAGQDIAVPRAGDRRYGIFRRDGDQLWLGKLTPENNGLEPVSRPIEFDPSPYQLVTPATR